MMHSAKLKIFLTEKSYFKTIYKCFTAFRKSFLVYTDIIELEVESQITNTLRVEDAIN